MIDHESLGGDLRRPPSLSPTTHCARLGVPSAAMVPPGLVSAAKHGQLVR
jgi:hypothetical protein